MGVRVGGEQAGMWVESKVAAMRVCFAGVLGVGVSVECGERG